MTKKRVGRDTREKLQKNVHYGRYFTWRELQEIIKPYYLRRVKSDFGKYGNENHKSFKL